MSTISLTVLRLIADPMHLNHDQIAAEAGIERGTVTAQIRHLQAQSLIYRPNGGDWAPTKAGHALIDNEPETSIVKPQPKATPNAPTQKGPNRFLMGHVVAALQAIDGWASPRAIRAAAGKLRGAEIPAATLSRALGQLEIEGKIERGGGGAARRARWIEAPAVKPTPNADAEWTKTDQVLCALDEHPEGLTNAEVGQVMSAPGNKIGGYLKALGERGDAVKVGGFGGKWYAVWHAPEAVAA